MNNDQNTVSGEQTVITGTVPPSELAKRLAKQQQQQVPAIAAVDSYTTNTARPAGTSSLLGSSESVHPLVLKMIRQLKQSCNNATTNETTQQVASAVVSSADGGRSTISIIVIIVVIPTFNNATISNHEYETKLVQQAATTNNNQHRATVI